MGTSESRFRAFVERLSEAVDHADRDEPLRACCMGLMLPGDCKSVEPMAARIEPGRVGAMHQAMHHFVVNASWSEAAVAVEPGEGALGRRRATLVCLDIEPWRCPLGRHVRSQEGRRGWGRPRRALSTLLLLALALATLLLALAVSAAYAPTPALAATVTMNISSGFCPPGTGWTTVTCWNNQAGPVPTTGDDVVIEGGQSQTNYDLGAGVQLHSITLNSTDNDDTNITGGPIALQSGGFITDNFGNGSFNQTFPGVTLSGSATFTLAAGKGNLVFGGSVTGTGPLTLVNNSSNDRLRLNVASTYTGATTVSGTARVRFDVNGAVPTGSALTVNGSALFQAASTIGSLAGGGNVFMNGSNALTVGGDNTSTTFSGVYQNSGGAAALTKTGGGTLTLSGANTYTGATTVNAGMLAVNGSIASPVTVNSGGTLGGTGTFNAVTVNNGGTLGPGLSTGIMNTGNLTLTSGSTLTIEINGPTVGTQYDQVNVTGTVNLGGATLNVVLGFTPTAGQVFTIINNDSTDAVTGTFAGLPEGATFTVGGTQFQISYVGSNDVTLTAVGTQEIPTLSEWAQLIMVALLLGGGLFALRSFGKTQDRLRSG